ncbi:MAG: hypothetical protein ACE5G5_13540 [Candidatus Methylomirabilales bacterium]
MNTKIFALVMVLAGISLLGCASHEIKALTPQPIDTYELRATAAGIMIAAEPFSTKEKVEKAFTIDLTEKGYVPILLVMENRLGDNVLLTKEEIELVDSQGNFLKPISAQVMAEKFEKSKMAYALLGFGLFSYMSADEANKKMRSDWSSKELPAEKILLPHRKVHGVVYFQCGLGLAALPNATLHIPFTNLRTGQRDSIRLRIAENIPVPEAER